MKWANSDDEIAHKGALSWGPRFFTHSCIHAFRLLGSIFFLIFFLLTNSSSFGKYKGWEAGALKRCSQWCRNVHICLYPFSSCLPSSLGQMLWTPLYIAISSFCVIIHHRGLEWLLKYLLFPMDQEPSHEGSIFIISPYNSHRTIYSVNSCNFPVLTSVSLSVNKRGGISTF